MVHHPVPTAAVIFMTLAGATVDANPPPPTHRSPQHPAVEQWATDPWIAARAKRRRRPRPEPKPHVRTFTPPAKLPPPPALPQANTIAILPLDSGSGVGEALVHEIEVALVREVEVVAGADAVSPIDVLNDVSRLGFTLPCDGDNRCVALITRYARAHLGIEVKVAAIGGSVNIVVRLVDGRDGGREVRRVAQVLADAAQQRVTQLHRLVIQLLKPATYVGSLRITCSEAAADVYVDDKHIGSTPLEKPIVGLRAGPHIVRISKEGFADLYRFVDVVYRRAATVKIDLTNNTVEGRIAEQESPTGYGQLFVVGAADLEVRLDGEPRAKTPLDRAMQRVPAGSRLLSFHGEGLTASKQHVIVERGRRTDIGVEVRDGVIVVNRLGVSGPDNPLPTRPTLVAVAPSPIPAVVPAWSPGGRFWLGGGSIALAAAPLVVAAVSAMRATKRDKAAQGLVDASATTPLERNSPAHIQAVARLERLNASGVKAETEARRAIGAGAGLLAIGVVLMLSDVLAHPDQPPAQSGQTGVAIGLTPSPFGLTVSGHF